MRKGNDGETNVTFKRELDEIFLRRQEEQLASYDVQRMRDEAKANKRRGTRDTDSSGGRTTAALKEQGDRVRADRADRDSIVQRMFNEGQTDHEIADRLSVSVVTVEWYRRRLGLKRKAK